MAGTPAHGPSAHEHAEERAHEVRTPGVHQSESSEARRVRVEAALLDKNDRLAHQNRIWFEEHELCAINFVSSPGSGKTTLLERTIRDHAGRRPIVVVQGDQATERDADRVRAAGAPAVQVNTGTGCHLDASMVARALAKLAPSEGTLVAIENVGNLVCPALFDLGEQVRIALMSVPEGADKPLKYPYVFRGASLVLLNKIDLLPYVDFDVAFFERCLEKVNPRVQFLGISATRGDGLAEFYAWLEKRAPRA